MKKLFDSILKIISIKLYHKMLLKRAVKDAKLKWVMTGKRHYVIPIFNEYIVVNSQITKKMKRKNGKRWSAVELSEAAVYITPNSTFHNI